MRVIGLAGWSGAGKTTLLTRLIPEFSGRGIAVSTIKHAHHGFDIDRPGKDSYRHREACATEVLLSCSDRWALMHERREEAEPTLDELISHLSPCDLVLIEGFKQEPVPKIEVYRPENGKPPLHPERSDIVAVAADVALASEVPRFGLDDVEAMATFIINHLNLQDRPC